MLYLSGNETPEYRSLLADGLWYAPFSYPFLFFNVYVQVMLMAVSRPKPSTVLSFLENILFNNLTILLLPRVLGITGVWLSFPIAELLTVLFSAVIFLRAWNKFLPETPEGPETAA